MAGSIIHYDYYVDSYYCLAHASKHLSLTSEQCTFKKKKLTVHQI